MFGPKSAALPGYSRMLVTCQTAAFGKQLLTAFDVRCITVLGRLQLIELLAEVPSRTAAKSRRVLPLPD
jgi:hypothetical protein